MQVLEIHKDQLDRYRKFVAEWGGIFNSPEWQEKVHHDGLTVYGIFEDDGQLTGVFHLYRKKYLWMSFVKNPPYIPHTGLVYINRSTNPSSVLSLQKKITEQVCNKLLSLNPDVLSVAFPPEINDMQVFFWNKFKVVPNYTYRIDLTATPEEIEKGFSAEHRNSMKKALKENVEVKRCEDYKIVRELVLETFRRKKETVSEEYVNNILFKFCTPENSFAYVSYANGRPIATAFCLYDKGFSYYMLGGYSTEAKHQGAGILCVYDSILYSREKGLKYFDFEGSMIREVERYFRGFGPELIPYYTVNKAKLPLEIALKFIKRQLF